MKALRYTAALVLALAVSPALAVEPFTAEYQASWKGLQADARMSLASAGGDRWTYQLSISNKLGSSRQTTVFEDRDGTLRPLSGNDVTQLLVKKSQKNAVYDWASGEARWSGDVKDDRRGPIKLQAGDLDAMLLNLALVRDMASGKPMTYRVVDNGSARAQTWRVYGKESVSFGGKSHTATKVGRVNDGKELYVWIVDGIPTPARILQREDGKDAQDLVLKSVR